MKSSSWLILQRKQDRAAQNQKNQVEQEDRPKVKHPYKMTVSLEKSVNNKEIIEFPLYHDSEIGLFDEAFTSLQIDSMMDEDVDTDEDAMNNAIKCCSRDFISTKHYLLPENLFRTQMIKQNVKNCGVIDRVARPEEYDRNGHRKNQV